LYAVGDERFTVLLHKTFGMTLPLSAAAIQLHSHKAAQKEQHKISNIQPSLHTHQTSGTPNQQLITAA